jgi:hypothetical protein
VQPALAQSALGGLGALHVQESVQQFDRQESLIVDEIEHELAQLGITLGEVAKSLRVREAEIMVHDQGLASEVGELIPRLEKTGNELKLLASRWHAEA